MGSDPTAASGGCREGSEWQRSHCKERLTQATHRAGTATGIVACRQPDGGNTMICFLREANESNLASSSKTSEIYGFQRFSFVIAENGSQKFKISNSVKNALRNYFSRLFAFLSFYQPFSWIVFDILPYFIVIPLIADHMVVIGTLEYPPAFAI